MTSLAHNCVLLADRHHGLAEGIRGLLETTFHAVVMVADEPSLSETMVRMNPEVAVVDLSLVAGDNLKWLEKMRIQSTDTKIVVISTYDEPGVRDRAMKTGINAYVLKRSLATDLLPAIEATQAGRTYYSEGIDRPSFAHKLKKRE